MSQVNFNTWKNATGTVTYYGATAWVNFDGSGTISMRDSANVSSLTDNGTGDYSINFTTALADANYAVTGATAFDLATMGLLVPFYSTAPTTTSFRMNTRQTASMTNGDNARICIAVFGGN